ncbi:MAG: DnaD domain protein [Lachnospiraceae bacterium]|nr:DnaD domain protein [Lachnospiraceae bacterium]
MTKFKVGKDSSLDITEVPNIFIDEYMKEANDVQIKVYLYLLRIFSANMDTCMEDIADKFNHSEKDVIRALKYWEKKGLLTLSFDGDDNLTGIVLCEYSEIANKKSTRQNRSHLSVVTAKESEEEIKEADYIDPFAKPSYSTRQIAAFKKNGTNSQIMFIAEQYIGRTLNATDVKTLMYISEGLGFSDDLIDYLIQYCVDMGKGEFKYIEKVAINWAKSGISTPAQAQKSIEEFHQKKTKKPSSNRFNQIAQHDYDFDAIEKLISAN